MTAENEIAHRRRVHELTHQLADLFKDVAERYQELRDELHVSSADIMNLALDHLPPVVRQEFDTGGLSSSVAMQAELLRIAITSANLPEDQRTARMHEFVTGGHHADALPPDINRAMLELVEMQKNDPAHGSTPLKRTLTKMFAAAPKIGDSDTPSIECHVLLKGFSPLAGALSPTPEGALKMLVPNPQQTPGQGVHLMEFVFDYDAVLAVFQPREVKIAESPLIKLS